MTAAETASPKSSKVVQEPFPEIPGFELRELIGRGGMGRVYRAQETAAGREVALKWLDGTATEELRNRFEREARAAAGLEHPNIVRVLGSGRTDKGDYIVMELVKGFPLQKAFEARALGPRALASVGAKVARALHAAHEKGVVHRDVKPGNILLDSSGEPKLVDFGLARFVDERGALTATKIIMGTLAYMSPEVASGGTADAGPASDVFSLGCVLYEGLSGKPPFEGHAIQETHRRILECKPAHLPVTLPGLSSLVHELLDKEPAKRPSAAVVAKRLEALAVPAVTGPNAAAEKTPSAKVRTPSTKKKAQAGLGTHGAATTGKRAVPKTQLEAPPGRLPPTECEVEPTASGRSYRGPLAIASALLLVAAGVIAVRATHPSRDGSKGDLAFGPSSGSDLDSGTAVVSSSWDDDSLVSEAAASDMASIASSSGTDAAAQELAQELRDGASLDGELPAEQAGDGLPTAPVVTSPLAKVTPPAVVASGAPAPSSPPIARALPSPPTSQAPSTTDADRAALEQAFQRNDQKAEVQLAQKLLLETNPTQKSARATCYAIIARGQLLSGHPRAATNSIDNALGLDPENPRAVFVSVCQSLLEKNLIQAAARERKSEARTSPATTAKALLLVASTPRNPKRHQQQHDRIMNGDCYDPVLSRYVLAAVTASESR